MTSILALAFFLGLVSAMLIGAVVLRELRDRLDQRRHIRRRLAVIAALTGGSPRRA